jgi:hypothetical protein
MLQTKRKPSFAESGAEAGGIARMIRDEPAYANLPVHALRVLAWSYRYLEEPVPDRDAIMKAMHSLAAAARR